MKGNEKILKRVLSILTALVILVSVITDFTSAEVSTDSVSEVFGNDDYVLSDDEYAQSKRKYVQDISGDSISLFRTLSSLKNYGYLRNDYIEVFVNSYGKYTMATTGGNPQNNRDDRKLLLFGHPSPNTTETLINIDGVDYFFKAQKTEVSEDGSKAVSVMNIGNVTVTQTISLQYNTYTGRDDIAEIKYDIINNSNNSVQLGGRIMLDTMLGSNDGAPFKIPGIGDITTETQYEGSDIPQYWQSFDNFSSPSVVASGTFYKTASQRPDKVQFVYWRNIRGSSWNYTIDPTKSVTGDSAVAVYYNPKSVEVGESRSFSTYYGLGNLSHASSSDGVDFIVTGDITEILPNKDATSYADNPFTITVYAKNNSSSSKDAELSLNLPTELVIGEAQGDYKKLTLAPGEEKSVKWEIWAKTQKENKTVEYEIVFKTDGYEKIDKKTLFLPAVSYHELSDFCISRTHLVIQKGKSQRLFVTLSTDSGTKQAEKYEVRWLSSEPSVAVVDSEGIVKGLKPGFSTIKVFSADYKNYEICTVEVTESPTAELDLWALSELAYKNLESYKGWKISSFIDYMYRKNEKFYDDTVEKVDYYKKELGEFILDDVSVNESSDFYAASFLDCDDGVVISYRGSNTVLWRDGLEDVCFALFDFLGEQFYDAWSFYKKVRAAHPDKKILLTGHSLGGALAAFVSIVEDTEAITFNGANGFIIDLAYYANANYISQFNGIDNWKFKNHYNEKDLFVGAFGAELYKSFAHYDNEKGVFSLFRPHSLFTLIDTDENGNISLSSPWVKGKYYLENTNWTKELKSYFKISNLPTELGLDKDKIKTGSGRVILGTAGSSIKKLTATGDFKSPVSNVFFSGGSSVMLGAVLSDDTFVFKNGDVIYGKGGNDTYITYESGGFSAEIHDPFGTDEIIFKNMSLGELKLEQDDKLYKISTGGGNYVSVSKYRENRCPLPVIEDKNGTRVTISSLPEKTNQSAPLSAYSLSPGEKSVSQAVPAVIYITGRNVEIDILDSNKTFLGSFDNKSSNIYSDEFSYVYTSNEGENVSLEAELFNSAKYVKIKSGEDIFVTLCRGNVGDPDFTVYSFRVDVNESTDAYINCMLDDEKNFLYYDEDNVTEIEASSLSKISAIVPKLDDGSAAESIDIYAGETVYIYLSFEPENIAVDDVDISLEESNKSVSIYSTSDNKIALRGKSAGSNTLNIKVLDGSGISVSIPVTVRQESLENVVLTSNSTGYEPGSWSQYPIQVSAYPPEGYDEIVYEADGLPVVKSSGGVSFESDGVTDVNVYARNSKTGYVTRKQSFELKIDSEAPVISGAQDSGVYYTDRLISVKDANLKSGFVNDKELSTEECINGVLISSPGDWSVCAYDLSGKASTVNFEIRELPSSSDLTVNDESLVVKIRNEFEDIKYSLSNERRSTLEAEIYELEAEISRLKNPQNSQNSILAFSVDGQIGDSYINEELSTVHIELLPESLSVPKTAYISVSAGAGVSPSPYVARDFTEEVMYTVTAADGSPRQWRVISSVSGNSAAPRITGGSILGNTALIEFDCYISGITNNQGFSLIQADGEPSANKIENVLCYNNLVSIRFKEPLDEMQPGEYLLEIAAESLNNISGVKNKALSYSFEAGKIKTAAVPTADRYGEISRGECVSLTTSTAGANIYYTLDGTSPTENSSLYTQPIVINSSLTVKAIAVKEGMKNSDVMSADYTVRSDYGGSSAVNGFFGGGSASYNDRVEVPKANVSETEVLKGTIVELSTSTKGAKIYYTTDGTVPEATAGTLYTAPIVITGDMTIKAFASKDGMKDSSVVTMNYNLRNPVIKIKQNAGKISYMKLKKDGLFMPDEAATRYEVIAALAKLFDIEKTNIYKVLKGVNSENSALVSLFAGAFVIDGYPDGTFGGENGITRAEFVKILTVMLGFSQPPQNADGFNDLENHWGEKYIRLFLESGYIKGYPDGSFRPDSYITRAEATTVINRIVNAEAKDSVSCSDVSPDHWAYEEIKKAVIDIN